MTDAVLIRREGAIATVVLNRPAKLNALNHAMWLKLRDIMQQLESDDALRCVVLRGAGEKAFAAGADISEFGEHRKNVAEAKRYGEAEHNGVMAVAECRHPTVALIQGACVGGGLEIAGACDLRIAGRSSRFGVPINRLGLTMAYPELRFFVATFGRVAALELLLEGSVVDTERALALGLVNRVVADDRVEAEAYASARHIAEGAPLVNRWHKKFMRRLLDPKPLTKAELDEAFAAFGTRDYQTGYRAFLEKRTPEFEGK
ncbi:MAG: enoyl-CoA hydratase/isomerase family protein [Gemmatimonadetes bacterium]|nr:enoyl-CoA hydratase/isomerase family protein [Gemmatimonadota bacterium]